MAKKTRSGFSNDAADKIWNDHLGNNAFTKHRDQCAVCLEVYRTRVFGQPAQWCTDGDRIFDAMLAEVEEKISEVLRHQN